MKKTLTILTIIMMVMSVIIVFAAPTGEYSPNGYFYKPDYGASGTEEWETFNTYIDKADAQIELNRLNSFAVIDTEAELETALTDVNNVYTDNDFSISDYLLTVDNNDTLDDLSDNSIDDLSDVNTTGKAVGKLLKFDASGNLIVGDDETGGGGGYTNLTSFVDQTAWRLFYSDGNGDVTELAFGDSGKYLKSNGATAAPSWDTPAGGGGATAFTDLTDTPANYTGSANKFLQVNATPDAIIFDTISTADLSDKDNVAMLNENEDVTGLWSFNSSIFAYIKSNDALACPSIYLERYRAGDTSVISGDKLGSILYVGYNESCGHAYGAFIDAIVDGTPDCDDLPTRLEFGTTNDGESWPSLRMAIDSSGNIKMGDGAWTNYVNISNAGVLTFEGTASINEPLSILASTTSAELAGVISDETGTGKLVFGTSPSFYSTRSSAPLGSELITNGTFNTDLTGWTATGWTWSAGTALHTTGNTNALSQSISVTSGQTYQIEFTISDRTAGNITVDINGVYIYNYGAVNTFTASTQRTLVANITGSAIFSITPTTDFNGKLDNITVKQITGVSIPQQYYYDDDNQLGGELRVDYGLNNTFLGLNAGYSNTTGYYNTFLGLDAGRSNTTGYANIFLGLNAGYSNTTGYANTFLGLDAGYNASQKVDAVNSMALGYGTYTTANNQIQMGNNDITEARIKVSWTVTSDERAKTNIKPLDLGLNFIKELNPISYQFKIRAKEEIIRDEKGKKIILPVDNTPDGIPRLGFSAQEVMTIKKKYGDKSILVNDHDPDNLGITYDEFIPVLVKAIQEQQVKIEELEARILELER